MDIRKIRKLIELLNETGVAEIEIKEGEESVRISRQGVAVSTPVHTQTIVASPVAAMPTNESAATANKTEEKF